MKWWIFGLAGMALLLGCSSYHAIPRSDLQPDREYTDVRVATLDGFEYRFTRVAIRPDTLEGFYTVTEERTGSAQEVWYEDVLRRQRLPLVRVVRVELVRKDPVKTGLYGASIAAAGYFLANLAHENKPKPRITGGGGKRPPGL